MRHEKTFFKQCCQINLIVLLPINNSFGSFIRPGKGNCQVILSCVVWKIRETFIKHRIANLDFRFFTISFLLGFSADAMFLGMSGSSISVIFFSITNFSFRSTKLENTSRDFLFFVGLADQVFINFKKQTF